MANENLNSESQQDVVQDGMDDVDAFIEKTQNSVSRDLYDKEREKNEKLEKDVWKLKNALISGKQIEVEDDKPVDLNELAKNWFENPSNLEGFKACLKYRTEAKKRGYRDPALPVGDQVAITDDHERRMDKVHEGLQSYIDYADGDPTVFLDTFQRYVVDPIIPRPSKKR